MLLECKPHFSVSLYSCYASWNSFSRTALDDLCLRTMSLGWKRFTFFEREERKDHAVPDTASCSVGNAEHLVFGCSDGQVCLTTSTSTFLLLS